eukprot:223134-Chlamydomonas_euryale.AAC.1
MRQAAVRARIVTQDTSAAAPHEQHTQPSGRHAWPGLAERTPRLVIIPAGWPVPLSPVPAPAPLPTLGPMPMAVPAPLPTPAPQPTMPPDAPAFAGSEDERAACMRMEA